MTSVVVTIECPLEKEMYDLRDKLCTTFSLLYSELFTDNHIIVNTSDDRNDGTKNTVVVILKGTEAIGAYPVVQKFMKWYGA